MTRGSALIEVLVLGFVAMLVVLQAIVATGRLQAAGELVTETAQAAALQAARTGDAAAARDYIQERVTGAHLSIRLDERQARVEVRVDVALVGPTGSPLRRAVTGRATAQVSPYRSHSHG